MPPEGGTGDTQCVSYGAQVSVKVLTGDMNCTTLRIPAQAGGTEPQIPQYPTLVKQEQPSRLDLEKPCRNQALLAFIRNTLLITLFLDNSEVFQKGFHGNIVLNLLCDSSVLLSEMLLLTTSHNIQ